MTFYRFIERASIRRNPQAGSTISYVVAGREAMLRVNCECPAGFVQPEGVASGSRDTHFCEFWWMLTDEDPTVKLTAVLRQFPADTPHEFNIKQDVIPIAHPPERPYLFDWAPCTVKCRVCDHIFDASELESDSDGDHYSDAVCPECGQWVCCRLECEDLDNDTMAFWADRNDTNGSDQEG
jgi:hypothetical protein